MYKSVNFLNLMEKNANKILSVVKKVDFWPNLHEIYGCHDNVEKKDTQLTYQNFVPIMNEQLKKVSAF